MPPFENVNTGPVLGLEDADELGGELVDEVGGELVDELGGELVDVFARASVGNVADDASVNRRTSTAMRAIRHTDTPCDERCLLTGCTGCLSSPGTAAASHSNGSMARCSGPV